MQSRKHSDKLRREREKAGNVLRGERTKLGHEQSAAQDKKKTAQRRQIRHESDAAKARKSKLRTEGSKLSENGKKGKEKPKKPSNPASDAFAGKLHQTVRDADEDSNSGTEAAHFSEGAAEGMVRTGQNIRYGQKLKQYRKLENAGSEAAKTASSEAASENTRTGSNVFSRWVQRQKIKKQYAAARTGASVAGSAGGTTSHAASGAIKGAETLGEKALVFAKTHSHSLLLIAAAGLLIMVVSSMVSSCSVLMNGGGNLILGTSYTAEKDDILGVEDDYTELEDALRRKIDRIPSDHPGYDEYRYNLAEIGHNPYELASLLTVEYEDYTRSEVRARLESIFEAQYQLTLEEEMEIRTRTEVRTGHDYDPETGSSDTYTYEVEVEYEYWILNVTLVNRGVDYAARNSGLNDDLLERYEVLVETRGNRDDLFSDVSFAVPDGEYTDYDIPGEALTDERFRKMITEAEKYLGYPYVWGGSSPSTSFDCSGFVSWVINHCGNGWSVGRQTANGLMGCCDIIPKSEAKPGDLIFFQGTYNTSGASHVGIYVGNGMMIHCGNPISYASVETSYWQQHYYCMGRIR